MKYVALLRGINVGGNTKIDMPTLRQLFENMGYQDVTTYINSGNVLFYSSPNKVDAIKIQNAIQKQFGFNVPVVIKSQAQIGYICQNIPAQWTNDKDQKTDVMFLYDEVDRPSVLSDVAHDPAIENVIYVNGALVWNVNRNNTVPGSAIKLIKSDIYHKMTVRNINTVRKLSNLLG